MAESTRRDTPSALSPRFESAPHAKRRSPRVGRLSASAALLLRSGEAAIALRISAALEDLAAEFEAETPQ